MDIYVNDSSLDQSTGKYGVLMNLKQEDKIKNLKNFLDALAGLQFMFRKRTFKDNRPMLNKKTLLPFEQGSLYSTLNIENADKLSATISIELGVSNDIFNNKDMMDFYSPEPDSDYSVLTDDTDKIHEYFVDLHKVYIKRLPDKQIYINKVLPLITDKTKKTFNGLLESRLVTD